MKRKPATTSTEEFCCGFSKRNLDYILYFYLGHADRLPRIMQKVSAQFAVEGIPQKPSAKPFSDGFGQTVSDQFGRISQILSAKLTIPERSSRKKDAIVKLTLPADANIHAREYQRYLPSKDMLLQKLLDWVREQEMGA
ncbi:MAG: hypothetical protein HY881_28430 [Deltaproteobacteria bacterium]|nr:hypothetical protein [Deltaproteobacteria bacterium]